VLAGYPPKPVSGDNNDLLTSLGITSGSVILLKEQVTLPNNSNSAAVFLRRVIDGDNSCLFNAIG